MENWVKAGWAHKPNIAYCTLIYVDESDDKAMDLALELENLSYFIQ